MTFREFMEWAKDHPREMGQGLLAAYAEWQKAPPKSVVAKDNAFAKAARKQGLDGIQKEPKR
ncbi:MAG TPA: hypothetical protein VMS77_07945 [Conexivisphaerales archaeon]|nr:hypothetical protein [Conexivisphaerales archaeon]